MNKNMKEDSGVASPNSWEEPIISTLSEQQHLVWDTLSRRTKPQDMLEFSGRRGPFGPTWLRL